MDKVIIENIRPYDGEYRLGLDDEPLTTLEWRWVKRISGYLPLTIGEGFAGGDPDVVCALAVVALRRAGKIDQDQVLAVADKLADAPFDGSAIRLADDEDTDSVPPTVAATEPQKQSGGASSRPTSAPSDSDLSLTGAPV